MFTIFIILASLVRATLSTNLALPRLTDAGSAFASGSWSLVQQGTSGVSGMQLAVVSETRYLTNEHNPLLTEDGNPAWTVELNLVTHEVRPLHAVSNTWCATGSFFSNGTLLSSGGNPVVITGEDGLQALRFFTPCQDGTCDLWEIQSVVRTTHRLGLKTDQSLSVLIFGGATANGWINNASANNPSYEFYPPKNINDSQPFLASTLNVNLFPIFIGLPDGTHLLQQIEKP
ncbi:glyoxal oxidase N-terminus-domain-containing protein [Mycena floridula]|nr:glyoxal oxidase N-terminus-domain-containing protein [Mycena floridula]